MPDLREQLAFTAAVFYRRGWMVGTSGNLSARADDNTVWITASGVPKGDLQPEDFAHVSRTGKFIAGGKPSAETSVHITLYELFDEARAVLHVHSVPANLVATMQNGGVYARLPQLEMLKGLGISSEYPTVDMPVLPNHHDVTQIANEVHRVYGERAPQVPGFLIRDHGLTAWGANIQAALNHIELFDFLFRYSVEARKLQLT